jgi:hypothetical protein
MAESRVSRAPKLTPRSATERSAARSVLLVIVRLFQLVLAGLLLFLSGLVVVLGRCIGPARLRLSTYSSLATSIVMVQD